MATHPSPEHSQPHGLTRTIATYTIGGYSKATTAHRTTPASGTPGYSRTEDAQLKGLRRIEGQIRGLQRMIEEDKYCIDVLTQVSAATKALQSFSLELLDQHLAHCVLEAAQRGGPEADEKVREASAAIARLVRS